MTMLPPTWVDNCASHSRRNGRLRSTARPPESSGCLRSRLGLAAAGRRSRPGARGRFIDPPPAASSWDPRRREAAVRPPGSSRDRPVPGTPSSGVQLPDARSERDGHTCGNASRCRLRADRPATPDRRRDGRASDSGRRRVGIRRLPVDPPSLRATDSWGRHQVIHNGRSIYQSRGLSARHPRHARWVGQPGDRAGLIRSIDGRRTVGPASPPCPIG